VVEIVCPICRRAEGLVALVESVARVELAGLAGSVALVESVARVELAGLAGSVASVVQVESVALVESVGLAGSVASVVSAEIARQPCRPADAATGNTIRNIEAALPIGIERPPTGLAAQPAVIRWRTGRPVRGNSLADRVAVWAAIAAEDPA
jgi:hypothetical protein